MPGEESPFERDFEAAGLPASADGPRKECPVCNSAHGVLTQCERLRQVALSINLFAIPAFFTDPLNRFVWVNDVFARLVGDPIRDRLPPDLRFIPATVALVYHDRFPGGRESVAQCLQTLSQEVSAGRLDRRTLGLLQQTLVSDELRWLARKTNREWDGTIVIKGNDGKLLVVSEQVVPVADAQGRLSGYNISLWKPVEQDSASLIAPLDERRGIASILTPRQLELARLFASGMTYRDVAAMAGITPGTARAHLEDIYFRLDIHSRAELTALLVREGLA